MLGQLRHMAIILMLLNAIVAGAARVHADETAPDRATVGERRTEDIEKEIDELRRHIEILTEEVRKMKEREVIPETAELKSVYGMGPAASKVYSKERGLSIGGYGEFNFKKEVDDKSGNDDVFDFVRFVGYLGYKFNDWILMNTEIEFEHASTDKDGSVSVEFSYLDFLLHERANVRVGLLLVPVGFINEIHEPPFYHGNDRPPVERQLIPTTWRANGAGLFGSLFEGLNYRTYAVTSLRAQDFSSANIRDGRQKGSQERAENFSWVGRLDYHAVPGLDFGASAYLGNQGQDDTIVLDRDPMGGDTTEGTVSAFMQMYEGHMQWHWRGIEARALGVWINLDDAGALSVNAEEPIGRVMYGAYGELAYNFLPLFFPNSEHYLAPWVRYSKYDTQARVASSFEKDKTQNREAFEIGLDYKPIPQVVLKLDYRRERADMGSKPDVVRVGGGFVF